MVFDLVRAKFVLANVVDVGIPMWVLFDVHHSRWSTPVGCQLELYITWLVFPNFITRLVWDKFLFPVVFALLPLPFFVNLLGYGFHGFGVF